MVLRAQLPAQPLCTVLPYDKQLTYLSPFSAKMEGSGRHHAFAPPANPPNSPPVTPSSARARFPSTAGHTSPSYNKRPAFPALAYSPPLDCPERREHNRPFQSSQPLPRNLPSRSPSASGMASAGSTGDSSPEPGSPSEESDDPPVQTRTVSDAEFTLEELPDDEVGRDTDIEVIRPDNYEDADSAEVDVDLSRKLGDMQCQDSENDVEEQLRRQRRRKKRWSSGLFKRSHSQSLGSDTDNEDVETMDAQDVGSSARRLRRRTRGPGDRSSLVFDDMSNNNIVEVEEPEDSARDNGPPALPLGPDGSTLEAMPFWVLEDPMEIDTESN